MTLMHQLSKCGLLFGLALWMTIILANNIIDPETNILNV